MSIIKGTLSSRLVHAAGIGNAYNIKRHIDIAAEHKVISHDEAHQLKKDYEKLYLGKPLTKQKVKDLLNRLKDKRIKISGTYLHTIAANPEKTITRTARILHAEENQKIREDNIAREAELQQKGAAVLLHASPHTTQQRGIAGQHAGAPIGRTLDGSKKAA